MGFWQGLNEGLTYVMEDKARKQELAAARQERLDERQANIDLQTRQYEIQKADAAALRAEERANRLQEIALPLYIERKKQEAEVNRVTAGAENLYNIFGGSEDPKVVALRNNPLVADALWKEITARREAASSKGVKLSIDPQTILDNIVINGSGEPISILSEEDFPEITNFEDLATAAAKYSEPVTTVSAELSPEYGFIPDPTNLKEGRDLFKQNLFAVAGQERDRILKEAGEDPTGEGQKAYGEISKLMEAASTDAAARASLEAMFGQKAFDMTASMGSAYTIALTETPEFGSYATQYKADTARLQEIVSDPAATPEQKTVAQKELDKRNGRF